MLRPKCCSKSASSLAMIACRSRRDVVVADDDAALGRELADQLAVAGQSAGDGVRLVVVERADLAEGRRRRRRTTPLSVPSKGGSDEQRRDAGLPCEANDDSGAWPMRRATGFRSRSRSYLTLCKSIRRQSLRGRSIYEIDVYSHPS